MIKNDETNNFLNDYLNALSDDRFYSSKEKNFSYELNKKIKENYKNININNENHNKILMSIYDKLLKNSIERKFYEHEKSIFNFIENFGEIKLKYLKNSNYFKENEGFIIKSLSDHFFYKLFVDVSKLKRQDLKNIIKNKEIIFSDEDIITFNLLELKNEDSIFYPEIEQKISFQIKKYKQELKKSNIKKFNLLDKILNSENIIDRYTASGLFNIFNLELRDVFNYDLINHLQEKNSLKKNMKSFYYFFNKNKVEIFKNTNSEPIMNYIISDIDQTLIQGEEKKFKNEILIYGLYSSIKNHNIKTFYVLENILNFSDIDFFTFFSTKNNKFFEEINEFDQKHNQSELSKLNLGLKISLIIYKGINNLKDKEESLNHLKRWNEKIKSKYIKEYLLDIGELEQFKIDIELLKNVTMKEIINKEFLPNIENSDIIKIKRKRI